MPPVRAKRIPTHPEAALTPYPKEPGEFRFESLDRVPCDPPADDRPFRLNMACPAGHGTCGSVIVGRKKPEGFKASWGWDGNVDAPTLTPSINCLAHNPENPDEKYGGCGWHAHLTAGSFA